jgi:hypothetical protein
MTVVPDPLALPGGDEASSKGASSRRPESPSRGGDQPGVLRDPEPATGSATLLAAAIGLTSTEAAARLAAGGPNPLQRPQQTRPVDPKTVSRARGAQAHVTRSCPWLRHVPSLGVPWRLQRERHCRPLQRLDLAKTPQSTTKVRDTGIGRRP